jgi:hypothetical protein
VSPGDKATLRLAIGLGLAVLVAYGLALAVPFVVCVMSVVVLSRPGPPVPLVKGLVIALLLAGLVAVGIAMVPLLEHYAFAGVLLTAVVLHALFYNGLVSGNPLSNVLVLSFAIIRSPASPSRPGRRAERRARDRRRHRRAGSAVSTPCSRTRRQPPARPPPQARSRRRPPGSPSGHADRDAGLRPRADDRRSTSQR